MTCRINDTPLVYFPVPKIACTSIKYAILNHNQPGFASRIASEVDRQSERGILRGVHAIYPTRPFRHRDRLRHFTGRWFCVVRDPVKRFLSAYSNRILFVDDLKHSDPAALELAGLSRQPELDEFIRSLADYRRINTSIDHHVAPMVDFLGHVPNRFHRIFDLSQMEELADYIAEAGVLMNFPRRQTGGPKLTPDMLSPASLRKLEALYAEDYRIFGRFMT